MTQSETILMLLRESPKTLRQIAAHPSGVFYEFRSRVSELRAEGYVIRHHKIKHCLSCIDEGVGGTTACPAFGREDNVYVLEEEPPKMVFA